MKIIAAILLIFLATSCGVNQGVERNYIISEAQTETQNTLLPELPAEVR